MARGLFRAPVAGAFADATSSTTGALSVLALAGTWLACITANVYIVGLNQLTDVGLDRINKPYLPLASGAWSRRLARTVVWLCFGVSILLTAAIDSQYLTWTVGLSLALGTAYSLPPFRLKRFNFWAAFCIIAVRSLIVNVPLLAHVAQWRAPLLDLPPMVWLLVFVMFAYSVAIAWFKDLPDDEGDAAFGVETLTVKRGKRAMLLSGTAVLGVALAVTVALSYSSGLYGGAASLLTWTHVAILGIFASRVYQVDLDSAKSIRRFYLNLWGLFFIEYIVFAVAAWRY